MIFELTDEANDWFDNEPDADLRIRVAEWILMLADTSPDPEDWVGVPIEDGVSRVAFVYDTDVVITYMPWHDAGILFVDRIESIPEA